MPQSDSLFRTASIFVPGFALGWMVGLSVSPVTQVVVTSIAALVVGVTAVLAGLPTKDVPGQGATSFASLRAQIRVAPLTFMLVGLAAGSALGVYTRANNWLGSRLKPAIQVSANDPTGGYLFAAKTSENDCTHFKAALERGNLQQALSAASDEHISRFAKQTSDPTALKAALEELICPASK